MAPSDQLEKLATLQREGILTDDEFEVARRQVTSSEGNSATHREYMQRKVAQIDREWELDRRIYLEVNRFGQRFTPTRGGYVVMCLFSIASLAFFGVNLVTPSRLFPGQVSIYTFIPLFIALYFLSVGLRGFHRAAIYAAAERRHRQRRQYFLFEDETSRE